ncbi:MAG: Clp1/GlmU family protein [Candidatus Calescibacterium sp.]|jgi:polynucleotide 5'-kinase involved in rRNA processing|nr:Clp1/GlmU family protein [Candidatus Calescibacterium sp.]
MNKKGDDRKKHEKINEAEIKLSKIGKFSQTPKIPKNWAEVIKEIRKKDRVIIVGGVDVGKTSFTIALERKFKNPAVIDLDPGQQRFFIPTCVSAKYKNKILKFFVGSTSPRFSEWLIILALQTFLQRLEKFKPDLFILDTPGFIEGDRAVVLKISETIIFRPTKAVVITEDKTKTEKLIEVLSKFSKVYILDPSEDARKISPEERAEIRLTKFKNYFSKTKEIIIIKEEQKKKIVDISPKIEDQEVTKLIGFFRNGLTEVVGIIKEQSESEMKIIIPEDYEWKNWDFAISSTIKSIIPI